MQTIKVTFPTAVEPENFIRAVEGAIHEHSEYSCEVLHTGVEAGENTYAIRSEDSETFYLAGIVAGSIMQTI